MILGSGYLNLNPLERRISNGIWTSRRVPRYNFVSALSNRIHGEVLYLLNTATKTISPLAYLLQVCIWDISEAYVWVNNKHLSIWPICWMCGMAQNCPRSSTLATIGPGAEERIDFVVPETLGNDSLFTIQLIVWRNDEYMTWGGWGYVRVSLRVLHKFFLKLETRHT